MLGTVRKLPINSKVGVVGGGFTGLTFTYFLSKLRPDVHITVFESKKRTGGWIESKPIYCSGSTDPEKSHTHVEKGPRTLRGVSDGTVIMVDMMNEMGKENKLMAIAKDSNVKKNFLLAQNNKLVQVPNSIGSLIKFSFSPLGKGIWGSFIGEWRRPPPKDATADESVASLLKRRFNSDAIGANIMSALYRGIYSGDIQRLSAKKTCNKMFTDERKYGSITKGALMAMQNSSKSKGDKEEDLTNPRLKLYQEAFKRDKDSILKIMKDLKKYALLGFKDGIETFPKLVHEYVEKQKNVEILCDSAVKNISKDKDKLQIELKNGKKYVDLEYIRLTIEPKYISEMISKEAKPLSLELAKVQCNTTVVVNFYLPNKNLIPKKYEGFGFLIPSSCDPINKGKVLGVVFDSVVEQNLKPLYGDTTIEKKVTDYTKLTFMLGGPLIKDLNSDSLMNKEKTIIECQRILEKILKLNENDIKDGEWDYSIAKDSLPQYFVGYKEWEKQIEFEFSKKFNNQISLGGMAFARSPGLSDLLIENCQESVKLA